MNNRPVEVWLFHPENNPPAVGKAKKMISNECRERHWDFQTRPTHLIKPKGRPIGQIKPEDATNLYRRVHRAQVGVWQIEHADVPTRPSPKATAGDYITLRQFVLHKAYHGRLHNNFHEDVWSSSLQEFLNWVEESHCENEGDPRCLPFHVFETKYHVDHLDSNYGRGQFADIHGAQSSRVDGRGFKWTRGHPTGKKSCRWLVMSLPRDFIGTLRENKSSA